MKVLWVVKYVMPSLGDFLGTLGGSSITGCYLHMVLVWLRTCLTWGSLCEVDLYDDLMTCEYMWLCLWSISGKDYCKVNLKWFIVLSSLDGYLMKEVRYKYK